MTLPLRPCSVCRQPCPGGRCAKHPPMANRYRPGRASVVGGAGSRATQALRIAVLERDEWICGYCHGGATTMDHIMPRSRGGATALHNLIACCASCNNSKKDKTLQEWIAIGSAPRYAIDVLDALS